MNIAFDQVFKAFSARREAGRAAAGEVRLAVMVAADAPAGPALELRRGLTPAVAQARLYVAGFGGDRAVPAVNTLSDAAVVLAGAGGADAARLWRAYRAAGVPCCVALEVGEDPAPFEELLVFGVAEDDLLAYGPGELAGAVGSWLVAALPDVADLLAAAFPCCRRVRALAIAAEAARNNALVGALTFLDGADLPVMLATEVAMVFKLAAAYGLPLDAARLREVAGVAASAFALRGCARRALRLLPLPVCAVKAAVAAGGTYAVGRALMALYDREAPDAPAAPVRVEPLSSEPVGAPAAREGVCA